jgi:hypothetical protein
MTATQKTHLHVCHQGNLSAAGSSVSAFVTGSMAWMALQLAHVDGFEVTELVANPFQSQYQLSNLVRLYHTGFPIHELRHTSHFINRVLLDLCKTLNSDDYICEVEGSFSQEAENEAKAVNARIWGVRHAIVVVNTNMVTSPMKDATGSSYCWDTALVSAHDFVERAREIPGQRIMVITPYNAQVILLIALREAAVANALLAGNKGYAKEITKILILTVDSSMGKDASHVILDTVGYDKGFFCRQPRTLVAGTRARSSLTFVGPTLLFSSSKFIDTQNRLKEALHQWGSERAFITTVNEQKMASSEQYPQVQQTLNILPQHSVTVCS